MRLLLLLTWQLLPPHPSLHWHCAQSASGWPCAPQSSPQVSHWLPVHAPLHAQAAATQLPSAATEPVSVAKSPPWAQRSAQLGGVRHWLPLKPPVHWQTGWAAALGGRVTMAVLLHTECGPQPASSHGPREHVGPLKPDAHAH